MALPLFLCTVLVQNKWTHTDKLMQDYPLRLLDPVDTVKLLETPNVTISATTLNNACSGSAKQALKHFEVE